MDEVMAMVHVAEQQGSLSSVTHQVKKMWGRDIGHLVPREHSVDEDTADMLIAALNQEISEADMQKRNLLLRDKVMFIAARCLKLTPTQLTQLEGVNFSTNCGEEFSFWSRIETVEQAYAMLRWYWFQVRPRLATKSGSALFVTHRGVAISPNGVGARFVRAVTSAGLRRSIPSWVQWINGKLR